MAYQKKPIHIKDPPWSSVYFDFKYDHAKEDFQWILIYKSTGEEVPSMARRRKWVLQLDATLLDIIIMDAISK